jgi:hypothetical protein
MDETGETKRNNDIKTTIFLKINILIFGFIYISIFIIFFNWSFMINIFSILVILIILVLMMKIINIVFLTKDIVSTVVISLTSFFIGLIVFVYFIGILFQYDLGFLFDESYGHLYLGSFFIFMSLFYENQYLIKNQNKFKNSEIPFFSLVWSLMAYLYLTLTLLLMSLS